MFVYNIKINGSKTFKYFFSFIVILVIIIVGIVSFKILHGAGESQNLQMTSMPQNHISQISSSNYSNILKAVHENIDDYIGTKISFTGYIYRVSDFSDNQFVLSRDMIISSDFQTVIVGFLCEYDNIKDFEDGSWINITGKITKGDYHGEMPIIEIDKIDMVNKPDDELVYPPDDTYIPTSGIV